MASRLPFAASRLWEWDSALYAGALEHGFHVSTAIAEQRPHPPGYIFYVATAAALHALGIEANAALVALSIVASGAAVAALYVLCVRMGPRPIAALAALAFAAGPLAWLYSDVAHPYIVLTLLSVVLALAFLATWDAGARSRIVISIMLGILAGFRQDLLIYFFPLWIWSLLRFPWRTRAAAAAVLGLACLAWLVPSALLSDGLTAYLRSVAGQFASLTSTSGSGPRSITTNTALLAISLAWALLGAGLLLVVTLGARAMATARGTVRGRVASAETVFFALWLAPPALFYVFAHIGEWGVALSIAPGLYALVARLLSIEWAQGTRRRRAAVAAILVAVVATNAAAFVGGTDPTFSASAIAQHDRSTDQKTAYIRAHHAPEATIVIAAAELLVARYYLPEYVVLFSDERAEGRRLQPVGRDKAILVYEPAARPVEPPVEPVDGNTGLLIGRAPAGSRLVLYGEADTSP